MASAGRDLVVTTLTNRNQQPRSVRNQSCSVLGLLEHKLAAFKAPFKGRVPISSLAPLGVGLLKVLTHQQLRRTSECLSEGATCQ